MKQGSYGLAGGFLASARRWADRPALFVDGTTRTYAELADHAVGYGAAILGGSPGAPLTAILASRSEVAYAGVLGSLLAGHAYVPLNPKFPAARLRRMWELSGADTLIVGKEALGLLPELLAGRTSPTRIILPRGSDLEALRVELGESDLCTPPEGSSFDPVEIEMDQPAYLLFTSGTTGDPKGVAVSHGNATSYIAHVADRFGINEQDRLSQHFDMTFDLSVHDMFVTWEKGACLCVIPESALMAPAKFIRDQGLTLWFSVPSAIGFMRRLGLLKPGSLSSLRCSLFCGEPLPVDSVQAWRAAASNSIVENLYGPTEATIAITGYRWDDETSPEESMHGVVPIGWPFDGQRVVVIGTDANPVQPGEEGELWLQGSQVTSGYWRNVQATGKSFVAPPALGAGQWYRTGDRVRQAGNGCIHFWGRIDDQVKIRGYRVELQEVENAIRAVAGTARVVAVAWPVKAGSAEGVVAILEQTPGAEIKEMSRAVREHCASVLPEYMVPRRTCLIDALPLNDNGKVDRRQLTRMLEKEQL